MNESLADGQFFVNVAYGVATLTFVATWVYWLYQRFSLRRYMELVESEERGGSATAKKAN